MPHSSPPPLVRPRILALGVVLASLCSGLTLMIAASRANRPSAPTARAHLLRAFPDPIGMDLVWIEAQTASIGSREAETGGDERPHIVRLTHGFWIGATEVTQGQWNSVMSTRPWRAHLDGYSGPEVAASCVRWDDAADFCERLTARERAWGKLPPGLVYRLPTEAEWELACRATSTGAYCCEPHALPEFAVFAGSRDGPHPHRVRSRRPNAWGLYDMHGNVWEWCADAATTTSSGGRIRVVTDTYRDGIVDPCGRQGTERICRGGSFGFSAAYLRSANRMAFERDERGPHIGFRVTLGPPRAAIAARREQR